MTKESHLTANGEYLPYYTEEERRRHDVRPGLTGWAQVNGRNAIPTWESRFSFDLEYVQKCSLLFDIKIILITIRKVLQRSDVRIGSEITAGRLDDARRDRINADHYQKIQSERHP